MFWLLAPLYRLLGSTSSSGLAAAAIQNAVVVIGIGLVAHRLGGRRLLLVTSVFVTALCHALGGELLASTWNPWLALLPFVLFLLLTWGVTRDDLALAPWAVLVGSFLVQTHVGYGALVGALGAWAVALVALRTWKAERAGGADRQAHRRRLGRAVGWSLLVGALAWVGPIIDQATNDPGNVRSVVTYFRDSPGEPVGTGVATDVAARQLGPLGPWLGGPEPLDFLARLEPTSPAMALPLALLGVAAAAVAWRRRDTDALLLLGTAGVGIAAGWLATSRITDQPYYYLFRWWWVLAMFAWLSVAWTLLRALSPPADRRVWQVLPPVLVIATAVLAGLTTVDATDPVPTGTHETAVEAMTPTLVEALDPEATYLVRQVGFSWFEELFGLGNQLDRHGFSVVADPGFAAQFGAGRIADDGVGFDQVLLVVNGSAVADALADPDLVLVAEWDPLTPEERIELQDLQESQRQALIDAGLPEEVERVENAGIAVYATVQPAIDPVAAERIAELLDRGVRVAVLADPTARSAEGDAGAPELPEGPAPAAGE